MRTLIFDQFEFPNPSTEEQLELWIAAKSFFPFPNVNSSVASTAGVKAAESLGPPKLLTDVWADGCGHLEYLQRFAGITVPKGCNWRLYGLPAEDYDIDCVIEGPDFFIRYYWWSSA